MHIDKTAHMEKRMRIFATVMQEVVRGDKLEYWQLLDTALLGLIMVLTEQGADPSLLLLFED